MNILRKDMERKVVLSLMQSDLEVRMYQEGVSTWGRLRVQVQRMASEEGGVM